METGEREGVFNEWNSLSKGRSAEVQAGLVRPLGAFPGQQGRGCPASARGRAEGVGASLCT